MSKYLSVAAGVFVGAVTVALVSGQQAPPAPPPPDPAAALPPLPTPAILQNYQSVSADRLKNPGDADWLMIRRTYDGSGYSPLAQITTDNVKRLQPVWVFSTGQTNGHEAPPLVNNGVMIVSTPGNQVIAIDAKTGVQLWRYRRELPQGSIVLHPTSRGVALYADKVFFASGDAALVALDAKTGKEVWVTQTADNKSGYYMSLAPLVADGKVMVGASGGELGIRGFIAGYDLTTGKELWKTHTVPAPGEPGSETWPTGDQWKTGGGSVWVTANYDPETNLSFWGTGNGGPWMGDQRPGDNLYTASTVAINVGTGKIVGHQQYNPNESWDWDEVSPPILVDYRRGGRTIKGLIDVSRSGYLWFLERTKDKINFIDGKPYVAQNVYTSLDPKTGRPQVDLTKKPGTDKMGDFCPSFWGGKNWPPISYNPKTRLIYIPANENLCSRITGRKVEYFAGRNYTGATTDVYMVKGADHIGEVQAWNVDTGSRAWTHKFAKSANWGPTMTTGGNLVFSGGTNDRMFRAFNATTGEMLWEFPTNSAIIAPASTFTVGGTQYVAVQSGFGIDSRSMQARLNRMAGQEGQYPEVPEGGAIWVFAVK